MQTRIHAAGPNGQRSPGLDAAIAGYLAENPGGVSEAQVEQFVQDYLTANPPSGVDAEGIQDVVGAMVVAAGGTYDDGAGTITLPSGAVVDLEGITDPGIALATAATTADQRASLGVGGLAPVRASGVTVTLAGSTPLVVDVIDGVVWGRTGTGAIHRSTDGGATWTLYATLPALTTIRRIVPTSDGEVLVVGAERIYKSTNWTTTPTFTVVSTPNGSCVFQGWGIDGDGTRFITTEYSGTRADSRYVRMSFDAGDTWSVVYDSVAVHGTTLGNGSHLHGCCYDPWGDRWYFTEGHDDGGTVGDVAGVYCSTDNGATWTRPAAMAQDSGPTVLVATPDGLVCGSDYVLNGIYGVRRDDPARQELRPVWRWLTGRPGLVGFATRGFYEPETGMVYMGWATAFSDVPPIIAAANVESGGMVWEWTGPQVNSDRVHNLVMPDKGTIIAELQLSGVPSIITAKVGPPSAAESVTVADSAAVLGGTATQGDSLAVGRSASASDWPRSTAVGQKATAGSSLNGDGTSLGYDADAIDQGTAIGYNAQATGTGGSTSVGRNAQATGQQGTAVGQNTKANSNQATSVGNSAQAGTVGTAVGAATNAGTSGTALGYGALSPDAFSVALGRDTGTNATYQVAIGARHIAMTPPASAPTAPTTGARLYTRVNGSSKHELCVLFPTGAVQIIATEP